MVWIILVCLISSFLFLWFWHFFGGGGGSVHSPVFWNARPPHPSCMTDLCAKGKFAMCSTEPGVCLFLFLVLFSNLSKWCWSTDEITRNKHNRNQDRDCYRHLWVGQPEQNRRADQVADAFLDRSDQHCGNLAALQKYSRFSRVSRVRPSAPFTAQLYIVLYKNQKEIGLK